LNGEANLPRLGPDDLDGDTGGAGNTLSGVTGIGKESFDERKRPPRDVENRARSVTVLDAGTMGPENEAAAIGIDECMTFATLDFLSRIIASDPAALSLCQRRPMTAPDAVNGFSA
jgi:hypothetical protein